VTPWEAAATNPDYMAFLLSRGWTKNAWNQSEPWERGQERTEFNGGLQKTGILRELPGAISETVREQGRAVTGVVKSVNRSMNKTLLIVAVIALAGASVVYRNELKDTAEAVKKAIK